jgi:hypothetical protein
MLSDLMTLLGLAKEIREMIVKPADGISFSIVTIDKAQKTSLGDHLRIINLLPFTICAVSFWLQQGEDKGKRIHIDHVYHPSMSEQPFGCRVIYRIPMPKQGIFLYPQGAYYYVPLSEYPNFNWNGDVLAGFYYSIPGKKDPKEGNLQIVTRASVIKSVPIDTKTGN